MKQTALLVLAWIARIVALVAILVLVICALIVCALAVGVVANPG